MNKLPVGAPTVDVLFNRGCRQDLDARQAMPGALVRCENLEFSRMGDLVRRDGFTLIATTKISKTSTFTAPARRFATGPNGESMIFTDDNTFCYLSSKSGVCEAALDSQRSYVSATLSDVQYIGADPAGTFLYSDVVYVSPWTVVVYTMLSPVTALYEIRCDVLNATTGERALSGSIVTLSAVSTIQPRVIAVGSVVFIVFAQVGVATITCEYIDLSLSTISEPGPTSSSLVADATNSLQMFDVCASYGGFVLAYRATIGGPRTLGRVRTFTAAKPPVLIATADWQTSAVADWVPMVIAVRGAGAVGEYIQAVGYDPASTNIQLMQLTSACVQDGLVNFATTPAGGDTKQLTIVRTGTTTSFMAFSPQSSTLTSDPRGSIKVRKITASPGVGAIDAAPTAGDGTGVLSNYSIGSRLFFDSVSTNTFMFARFNDPTGAQSHLCLIDWGALAHIGTMLPMLHIASGRVPLKTSNTYTGLGGLVQGPVNGAQGAMLFIAPINVGSSVLSGQQIGLYTLKYFDSSRYLSCQANGGLIVGGATPLCYDGQRLAELSFYYYPPVALASAVAAAAGGNIVAGTYLYRFVYEWVDAIGNRHQSPASPAVTITHAAGVANQVTWTIPTIHTTRKQRYFEGGAGATTPFAAVRIVMYRTTIGGTVYFRHSTVGINSTSVFTCTIVDTLADASVSPSLSTNEQLYEQRGVLSSTAPPPSYQMMAFGRRLWGVDCERPERIWCTKTFEDGESPGYNPALQITIPGAGRINGLAAQDGKLYALATNGIYLASYGDGPTNTAQGGFPEPSLLTVTANCTDPRSVLLGQEGIYFCGDQRWGTTIFLIRRGDGNPVDIGARVRDDLAAYPYIRSAIDNKAKARVEFLAVDSDDDCQNHRILYYHYDLLDEEGIGQWTTARYQAATVYALGDMGGSQAIADTTTIAVQTAAAVLDATFAFSATIETADMRPFGLTGYGTVDAVTLVARSEGAAGVTLSASYDSGDSYPEYFVYPASTEAGNAPVLRRWESPTKKLPRGSVRYRITDDTGIPDAAVPPTTLSIAWHGLSIETTPLGGNVRLSDAERG